MEINVHYKDVNASYILGEALRKIIYKNGGHIVIVCIGTDIVMYDSLGPLVGTLLMEIGISAPIFGKLDDPIHAQNIEVRIKEVKDNFPNHKVIAIDGCLGDEIDVGNILLKEGGVKPGQGVGKNILEVGDYAIKPIIEKSEASKYLRELQIRLRYIFSIAVVIKEAFVFAYNLDKN